MKTDQRNWMPLKVMVVDDDRDMLLSLKEGFEDYQRHFSLLMAGDGKIAVEKLKENAIALVVTKINLPRMDGMQLLSYISAQCPDLPVIVMGDYGVDPSSISECREGAFPLIEKPFLPEELAELIIQVLNQTRDGGTLNNMSAVMFLQALGMEQKTCIIRVNENVSGKQGILMFNRGELMDARVNTQRGENAALDIFSWDDTFITIQNSCPQIAKNIHTDLQAIMLEAMRRKDESGLSQLSESAVGINPGIGRSDDQFAVNLLFGTKEDAEPPSEEEPPIAAESCKHQSDELVEELVLSLDDGLDDSIDDQPHEGDFDMREVELMKKNAETCKSQLSESRF